MGMFSWFRKKVVEPVVNHVVKPIVEPIVENVIEPVIEAVVKPVTSVVTTLVETVIDTIVPPVVELVETAIEKAQSFVEAKAVELAFTIVNGVTDKAFETLLEIWDRAVDKFGPAIETDYAQFAPVSDTTVEHVQISTSTITVEKEVELRDAIISSQVGHADYDTFFAAGAIDVDGYVLDEELFYETGQWYEPLEDWGAQRFDVIRVVESSSDFFIPTYEANVALMHNQQTDTYFISVGGTVGLADIITDINLVVEGSTGDSVDAITSIIDDLFENDIPTGAAVVLSGMSLGGAEVVQQYRLNPDAFDHVYAITSAGLGGVAGTYYNDNVWDGMGDPNITELNGDDPGFDFNDMVTSLGHIGAGQTYFIDEIIQAPGDIPIQAQLEAGDSHNLGNIFASLPGGANPDVPVTVPEDDAFLFA